MASTNLQQGHSLYSPLDHNIRLIEILPTFPGHQVQCKLHTEIVVDGIRKQVTVNLATALRHLKQHWSEIRARPGEHHDPFELRVWADALCINQDNHFERTPQVGLMADSYSSADMVLAWLTSNDRDLVCAFTIMHKLLHYADLYDYQAKPWPRYSVEEYNWFQELKINFPLRLNKDTEAEMAFSKFWRLSFWTRVWTQQEVILAKELYFITPSQRIYYKDCILVNTLIKAYLEDSLSPAPFSPFINLPKNEATKMLEYQCGATSLLEIKRHTEVPTIRVPGIGLYLSGHLQATDKLDYVYGLLALTKAPIVPDYAKSVHEVYWEFAKWLVEECNKISRIIPRALPFNARFVGFLDANAVGIR
ncbi:unnamed protein product [Fusarium graminearum]|uniref:Heterokaryon incompatibility domain-containing protein n=1 Tax=Gibberella zeae TaxID=5518 RepID=A0A679P450_GIBZA|nr:unnamed protein product [Fusarium graminearum]CAF3489530.1 unnamed protein product [Fusarium graminearum]CAG1976256.1 unnamed protein product [Fusarium graminearum]CAG1982824.1 unnamed protein product [Fusarium graminearum]CZS84555.1 unnamed protein product [Fusarium graminearum]